MNILHAKVAVSLHVDALDIILLVGGVLPLAFTSPIHGDLAVALHLELDRAVRAPKTGASRHPLSVAERTVRRHVDKV